VQAGADVVLVCHSLDEQEQAMNALVNAVKLVKSVKSASMNQ